MELTIKTTKIAMKKLLLHSGIIIFIITGVFTNTASSQVNYSYRPDDQKLYDTIVHLDSVFFSAYNNCTLQLDKYAAFYSDSLEFYHDKGGFSGYKQTIENFSKLFENNKTTGLRRDLVKGSLEVYPIKDYGAVETCMHRFCHVENGTDDCGTFKNVMVWQKKNGQWKVTRVVSYDH